jgi:uncharacterized protein
MQVEVAYATEQKQVIKTVKINEGCTAFDAITKSGITDDFKEIDIKKIAVGIFSKACKLDTVLEEGQRVEIYRPLIADPKTARKKRAKRTTNKKK